MNPMCTKTAKTTTGAAWGQATRFPYYTSVMRFMSRANSLRSSLKDPSRSAPGPERGAVPDPAPVPA